MKALGFSNCILALDTPFTSEVLDMGRYGLLFKKDMADLLRSRLNWDLIAQKYLDAFEAVRK